VLRAALRIREPEKPMKRSKHISYIAAALGLVASGGCVADSNAAQGSARSDSIRFVEHPDYIRAGLTGPNLAALALRDPFGGSRDARTAGATLYLSYNCVDCHGMDGSGAMAPSLADGRWRFGGSPSEVFESIYQGRPEGMPAWGGRISDGDVWRLVAYVRSLGAGKDVTTENFTGKAQERMGH
jgi:cytochrome c oxidase cbb3-type subunit III